MNDDDEKKAPRAVKKLIWQSINQKYKKYAKI